MDVNQMLAVDPNDREAVKRLQTELRKLGLYSGNVDGKWGQQTIEGVKAARDVQAATEQRNVDRARAEAAKAQAENDPTSQLTRFATNVAPYGAGVAVGLGAGRAAASRLNARDANIRSSINALAERTNIAPAVAENTLARTIRGRNIGNATQFAVPGLLGASGQFTREVVAPRIEDSRARDIVNMLANGEHGAALGLAGAQVADLTYGNRLASPVDPVDAAVIKSRAAIAANPGAGSAPTEFRRIPTPTPPRQPPVRTITAVPVENAAIDAVSAPAQLPAPGVATETGGGRMMTTDRGYFQRLHSGAIQRTAEEERLIAMAKALKPELAETQFSPAAAAAIVKNATGGEDMTALRVAARELGVDTARPGWATAVNKAVSGMLSKRALPIMIGAAAGYDAGTSDASAAGASPTARQVNGIGGAAAGGGLTAGAIYGARKAAPYVERALGPVSKTILPSMAGVAAPGMIADMTDYTPEEVDRGRAWIARNLPDWAQNDKIRAVGERERLGAMLDQYELERVPKLTEQDLADIRSFDRDGGKAFDAALADWLAFHGISPAQNTLAGPMPGGQNALAAGR